MFDDLSWVHGFGTLVPAIPLALFAILSFVALFDRRLSEQSIGALTMASNLSGLLATIFVCIHLVVSGEEHVEILIGDWAVIPHYDFQVKLTFDVLSIAFVLLTFVLCGVIGWFATRYLHRERGFNRFFVLFALFQAGMVIASLGDNIAVLFIGWEMVGLSGAFLVAFFQERPAPPRQGLHIWIVYRVADAALLGAAFAMHHHSGTADFNHLFGDAPWPNENSNATPTQALIVGFLLLIAAAGKSALIPFSGWLPRAMEGPTPSSAIFYGALSVHLGAYLLLRASPLLEASPLLAGIVVTLGLLTALYAYLAGSVQTDIKSALAYASLVQVGLIFAEIGFGWRYIPLAHMVGHACLRTVQFLRAPTLLHDYHTLSNAIGDHLHPPGGPLGRLMPARLQLWLYRFGMERGYLDAFLSAWVVMPFILAFRYFDKLEHCWMRFLKGERTSPDLNAIKEPK